MTGPTRAARVVLAAVAVGLLPFPARGAKASPQARDRAPSTGPAICAPLRLDRAPPSSREVVTVAHPSPRPSTDVSAAGPDGPGALTLANAPPRPSDAAPTLPTSAPDGPDAFTVADPPRISTAVAGGAPGDPPGDDAPGLGPPVVAASPEPLPNEAEVPPAPDLSRPLRQILAETVVRAPGLQSSSSRIINGRELALSPRRSPDELLRFVPGLWTSPHGAEGKSPQLFLRGFDAVHGADLEVRVGGFAINEMSNVHGQGYLDLGLLIPEVISEVLVDKGALDVDQGPFATAGSVRFELGVPEAQRGLRLSYELGSTHRHRGLVLWAPKGAPSGTFVAAEGMTDRGYGENRGSQRLVVLGQLVLPLPARLGRLTALIGAHALHFGEPGVLPLADLEAGRVGFYDSLTPYGSGRSERALAGLTWERRLGSGHLTARLHAQARHLALDENFTGQLLFPAHGDRRLQQQGLVGGGAELAFEQPLAPRLQLKAGAAWTQEGLSQRETRLDRRGDPWEAVRHLKVQQSAASARAALRWRPVPALRLEGGLRFDAFRMQVRDQLDPREADVWLPVISPRVKARLQLAPGWSLDAGAGRGVRPPEARTALARTHPSAQDAGAANDTVSTADGAELGVTWVPSPALQTTLSTFATHVSDEVTFDHVSGTNLESGESRRMGLELGARLVPVRWLELRGELTLSDARYVASDEAVPNAPRLLGSLWAGASHPSGVRGGLQLFALGPRPLAHRAQAGALATIDLFVGWQRGPLEVSVSVDNLLDSRVRAGEYHFASAFDPSAAASPLPALHFSAGPARMVRARVGWTF